MKSGHDAALARGTLDKQFPLWRRAAKNPPPPNGWFREIREALGMTSAHLADAMNLRQATVTAMEKAERNGGIRLATLRRAAKAMGCQLVYALAPKRKSLDEIRDDQATMHAMFEIMDECKKAGVRIPGDAALARLAEKRGRTMNRRHIWKENKLEAAIRREEGGGRGRRK